LALRAGAHDVAACLVEHLGPRADLPITDLVQVATESGSLPALQWLIKQFDLSREQASFDEWRILRYASWNGHLLIVQWLVSYYDIQLSSFDSAYMITNIIYSRRCRLLRWFVKHFRIDAPRLREAGAYATAGRAGNIKVAAWLVARAISKTDALRYIEMGAMSSDRQKRVKIWARAKLELMSG